MNERMRHDTGSIIGKLLLAAGLLMVLLLLAGLIVVSTMRRPMTLDADRVMVDIEPGAGAALIADTLEREGVIASALWFRLLVTREGADGRLRAGTYSFDGEVTPRQVLAKLLAGPPSTDIRVTIPEGLTIHETIRRLAEAGLGREVEFREALTAVLPLINTVDPDSVDGEGYLFPDTYRMAGSWDQERILRTMVRRFVERAMRTLGDIPGGATSGHSLRDVVTLASLVEKETGVGAERDLVAGVFANRLRIGMRLQCDPTVIYALRRVGRSGVPLLRTDLSFDSPWNTYRYTGLPPGPICCPGEAALAAACRPAATNFLYFVADGKGGHDFSSTIGEHNRAVARYRAWQRANRH